MIEASGVCDPAGIAQVAASVDGVRMECMVFVVDAATSQTPTPRDHLLRRQVAPASLIVLNKTDLVVPDTVELIAACLSAMAPDAQNLRSVQCAVPPPVIPDAALHADMPAPAGEAVAGHDFAPRVFRAPPSLPRTGIEWALHPIRDGILRIMGFLNADGEARLLQALGRRWTRPPARRAPEPALVVIGRTGWSVDAFFLLRCARLRFSAPRRANPDPLWQGSGAGWLGSGPRIAFGNRPANPAFRSTIRWFWRRGRGRPAA